MGFGDADRAYLLGQDFGVTVDHEGTQVDGIFDEASEDVLPGQYRSQSGTAQSVLVATGSIDPSQGDVLTVDGTAYTVVDVNPQGVDGRLTRIVLAECTALSGAGSGAVAGFSSAGVGSQA